ncbi:MAG TPA: hypothetical protein VFR11_03995 [Micromonosporaceae bacterium]|nr:hypothetical protein [Micromonosporaceae bacterium]
MTDRRRAVRAQRVRGRFGRAGVLARIVSSACIVSLAVAACSTVVPPIPRSAPTVTDPAAQRLLTTAIGALATTSYQVRVTASHGRLIGTGSVLPASSTFDVRRTTAVEGDQLAVSARRIGGAVWLNVDYPSLNADLHITPAQWVTAAPKRLSAGPDAPFDLSGSDPFDLAGLLAGVTVVRAYDSRHLTGIIDYTRSHGVSAPDADELSEAGTAATSTPFGVTLDGGGRLLSVVIDADGYNGDLTRMVALSGYGSVTPPVRPPAAVVVPTPAAVYELFNEG